MIVLAGVDGSERAYAAISFASQLLRPDRDQWVLYCSPRRIRQLPPAVRGDSRWGQAGDAVAQTIFEQARTSLPEPFRAGLSTVVVGDSKPAEGIISAAEAKGAELIVVGAHGATEHRPLFPGGVARAVAHRSPIPVLMVRQPSDQPTQGAPTQGAPTQKPLRVMVAHCRTPAGHAALDFLGRLAWPEDTVGQLLHVVETLDPSYVAALQQYPGHAALEIPTMLDDYQQHVEEEKRVSLQHLQEAQTALPAVFRATEPLILEGHPVDQILAAVEREAVDLLIVGARSLSALERWLSSTTESLMLHCPTSLLIVHAPEANAASPR